VDPVGPVGPEGPVAPTSVTVPLTLVTPAFKPTALTRKMSPEPLGVWSKCREGSAGTTVVKVNAPAPIPGNNPPRPSVAGSVEPRRAYVPGTTSSSMYNTGSTGSVPVMVMRSFDPAITLSFSLRDVPPVFHPAITRVGD
jgi:hypothetical protein